MAAVKKKAKRGNPNLKKGVRPLNKDGKPLQRPPGSANVISRALKDAIIWATEHSKDSKDGTLESYVLDLADNHKALFVPLLGRLLPLQINARTMQTTKIVYKTVAEVRAALIAKGMSAEKCDLLLLGKIPEPVPVEVLGDVKDEDKEE
jgi:hypothetical protein